MKSRFQRFLLFVIHDSNDPRFYSLFFPPFSQHPSGKYLIKTPLVNLQILINTIQIKIDKNYKPWIHTERDAHKVPMCAPSTIQYRSWMKEGSPQVRAVRVTVYQGCFHGHVCNPPEGSFQRGCWFLCPCSHRFDLNAPFWYIILQNASFWGLIRHFPKRTVLVSVLTLEFDSRNKICLHNLKFWENASLKHLI